MWQTSVSRKEIQTVNGKESFQCAKQCQKTDACFSFTCQIWNKNKPLNSCFMHSRKTQGHLTLKKKPHQNARTIKFTEFMTISYALHKRHFSLMYRRQILAIKQLDMPNSKYEKFILVVSTLRKSTFFRMTHTRYPLITCTTENFPSEWRKKVYWVICIFSLSLYTDRLFENWSVVTAHPLNMHCMDEV